MNHDAVTVCIDCLSEALPSYVWAVLLCKTLGSSCKNRDSCSFPFHVCRQWQATRVDTICSNWMLRGWTIFAFCWRCWLNRFWAFHWTGCQFYRESDKSVAACNPLAAVWLTPLCKWLFCTCTMFFLLLLGQNWLVLRLLWIRNHISHTCRLPVLNRSSLWFSHTIDVFCILKPQHFTSNNMLTMTVSPTATTLTLGKTILTVVSIG